MVCPRVSVVDELGKVDADRADIEAPRFRCTSEVMYSGWMRGNCSGVMAVGTMSDLGAGLQMSRRVYADFGRSRLPRTDGVSVSRGTFCSGRGWTHGRVGTTDV